MVYRCAPLFLCLLTLLLPSEAAEPIKGLSELKALEPAMAAQSIPVELEATVLRVSPLFNAIYVHDGEYGAYVSLETSNSRSLALRPAKKISIKGFTHPGSYVPHIVALNVEILSEGRLPKPIPLTRENLNDENLDCAWVTTKGTVLGAKLDDHIYIVTIEALGQEIRLFLPDTMDNLDLVKIVLNSTIEVDGVLCSLANDQRQLIERYLGVPSAQFIRVTSPDQQENIPLKTIDEILAMETPGSTPVRVHGTVTYHDESRVVIQEQKTGLLLRTTAPADVTRGDHIEAIGLVSPETFSTALKTQSLSVLESGSIPKPVIIRNRMELDPSLINNTLVTLDAKIREKRIFPNGSVLTCSIDGSFFQVGLPISWAELKQVPSQSTAKITGILQHSSSAAPLNPTDPDGFQLLVMNIDDIDIQTFPSWWNLRGILTFIGIIIGALVLVLGWVYLLRRKVAEQTATISAKIAQESSSNERQRVARELHDSLEQNLTACAFQIDNVIRFHKNEKYDKLGPALDFTRKMLKACQRESREAIYDLRGTAEESAQWRDEMLLSEAERLGSKIRLKIRGKSYSLGGDEKRQVRRIVREATYNSIRHGEATDIRVEYIYEPELFTAIVRDNGSGFDTKGPRPEGHFGLAGMEERAGRIGAKFILESEPGSGTTVSIRLPVRKSPQKQHHDQSPSD